MNLNLNYRLATIHDLSAIVHLLFDDELGSTRESANNKDIAQYHQAFHKIKNDPNQELTIVLSDEQIIGTFQLTFIQYLTYQGGLRAQIEAVRVASAWRGKGIGHEIFQYAINRTKEKGCHMIQLTSDKRRPDAIRFYESLGFRATHEGMKLFLL